MLDKDQQKKYDEWMKTLAYKSRAERRKLAKQAKAKMVKGKNTPVYKGDVV